MSDLLFRNVDVPQGASVGEWPVEAIVTAIERGMVSDWRALVREVRRAPWGRVSRVIEEYSTYGEVRDVAQLLMTAVARERDDAALREADVVAQRVRAAVAASGLPAREFARECGTSASRLSTYMSGKVIPSAAMLVRMEAVAACVR